MNRFESGDVIVRNALAEDIDAIKDSLREKDVQELLALGQTPESALRDSFERSEDSYTILHRGVPVAMFGVVPDQRDRCACVWFLGTDGMGQIKKTFVKTTKLFIDEFLDMWPMLYNAVDARYFEAVKWLEHAGAEAIGPKPYGPLGYNFYLMTFRRHS